MNARDVAVIVATVSVAGMETALSPIASALLMHTTSAMSNVLMVGATDGENPTLSMEGVRKMDEKRLIDANAFFDKLKKLAELMRQGEIGEIDLNLLIASTPTVDAVEVVHAHWEDGCCVDCYGNIAYKSIDCSHCEEIFKIESRNSEYWKNRFKVCPFCGAKMDGGNEDG